VGHTYPTAGETIQLSTQELEVATPPLELHFSGKHVLIVPWTLVMAQFSELRAAL
jgi:hypothetical protein